MKKRCIYITCLILFLTVAGCNKKVSQEDLIQSALALKINQWRQVQLDECAKKALADAEAYVDSILIIRSLPTKLDTIPKPPKPRKPSKPYFRPKPDSMVVEELDK